MRFAILALCALSACREGEELQPSASRLTSPGGIGYTLIHLPGNEDVSIQVAWHTDWVFRAERNPAAPLVGVDLILGGGAEGYPAGEVIERIADLDAEGGLTATVDMVFGQIAVEKRHMSEMIGIANAHLRAPSMDEMWFTRIRESVSQSVAETGARADYRGFEAVRWAVLGDQPLRAGLSPEAPAQFDALTREDVAAWHGETLTRSPAAAVVAGDLTPREAGAALDALLAGLPEGGNRPPPPVVADFSPRRILLHTPEGEVTFLGFVAPLPPTRLGGDFEDLILTDALGGDDRSVLFETVRTGLRASYGFEAGTGIYTRDLRILFMAGFVETAKLAEAERRVNEAYAAFRAEGPSGPLAARTDPLKAWFASLPDYITDLTRTELEVALDGDPPGRSLTAVEEVAAISAKSLADRLATAFPAAGDFIVIAVSPDANALPGACVIRDPKEAADCP